MGKLALRIPSLPVYLINSDGAVDRPAGMGEMLDDVSLPDARVPAVDGNQLPDPPHNVSAESCSIPHGKRRNPIEFGTYLTHIECARSLLETLAEHPLALEDDLLPPGTYEVMEAAIGIAEDCGNLQLSRGRGGRAFPTDKSRRSTPPMT